MHSNRRGGRRQQDEIASCIRWCTGRSARCHPHNGLRAEQLLDRGRNPQEPPILAIARRQHQTDRQAVAARQRQRDSTQIEEVDDRGIAQRHLVARERGFGVPALRDGRRRDCAGRQHDGVEIGKARIHGPHHRGTIADQNYVIGCGNLAPALDPRAHERIELRAARRQPFTVDRVGLRDRDAAPGVGSNHVVELRKKFR